MYCGTTTRKEGTACRVTGGLCVAIREGDTEKLAALIRGGACVDERDYEYAPSDTGASGTNRYIPLYLASMIGRADHVRMLCEAGANVNATTSSCTALHVACYNDEVDVVRTLMFHGADPFMKDNCGSTALVLKGDTFEKHLPGVGPGAREIRRCLEAIRLCRCACVALLLCSPVPPEISHAIAWMLWQSRVDPEWSKWRVMGGTKCTLC
eukprot:TRINITY_DN7002_c0_g1_i1.p1 TRINITY_DN7002_c0_g1~~TRINITY_DN7002_c0_g1_i1.p1  ORF type:complete len:210 (-),score=37.64 TRINITY_DN7002_c0_g1_i1:63-692(-)